MGVYRSIKRHLKHSETKADKPSAKSVRRTKGQYRTYYIHSTGVIKGPNFGAKLKAKNRQRAEFGNLYSSQKSAERALKRVRAAL